MSNRNAAKNRLEDFSLMLGGPLYNFYKRINLAKNSFNYVGRRILALTMFTWLPLLILATFGGAVISDVQVPFIFDLDPHVRFIASLGLLIFAEVIAHARIKEIIAQFLERDILTPEERPQFDRYIDSIIKLRDSKLIEIVLLIIVVGFSHWFWLFHSGIDNNTWFASIVNGKRELNLAGYWYVYISLPIFQFIFLRWYFRMFLWYKLVWQISRLPLTLNSLHPDRAGGLSFLAMSISAFTPFILAHTILLAGKITNRVWHDNANLLDFKLDIIGLIVFLMFVVTIPMMFFLLKMAQEKRNGTEKYGVLSSHFVNYFREKWLDRDSIRPLIVNEEIQSLADLSNSYTATRDMNIMPFTMHNVLQLLLVALLPILPLIFTMIPIAKILEGVARIFI